MLPFSFLSLKKYNKYKNKHENYLKYILGLKCIEQILNQIKITF